MYFMSSEQVLAFIGMLVGSVIAIRLMGEFANYVINKITNNKERNDKTNNSIR
ncbi:hypothetical protein [Sporosarcina limicola]|uniref:Uncharacterized protein n=1 Tax=Sporosarcina limicola TaxID=34101 RepID=A0A927MHV5_9BACL|nr:hypothetical protein [Sporosarcina limicola]MBE1554158.1 hypothetical protein [Sporosarcina limicola]